MEDPGVLNPFPGGIALPMGGGGTAPDPGIIYNPEEPWGGNEVMPIIYYVEDSLGTYTSTYDTRGFLTSHTIKRGNTTQHAMTFNFENGTGNLLSRSGMTSQSEIFQYDDIDRLTQASGTGQCSTTYDNAGNILSKSELGSYSYDSSHPHAVISVDTFRPQVARIVVEEFGADIINDVGAPANSKLLIANSQENMFRMVSRLRVPYIFMSRKSTIRDILLDSAEAVDQLRSMGQKDIIIDPGFGFGKTLEQNYEVMQHMERLQMLQLPLLVGISRKSMIYKLLQTNPEQALNGTTTLHTIALLKGANILRVHDVREAVECMKIVAATKSHFTLNRN